MQSPLDMLAAGRTDGSFFIEFGTLLYNALFTGDIESLFQVCLGEVAGQEARDSAFVCASARRKSQISLGSSCTRPSKTISWERLERRS